jgi:hypothetical protein
MADQQEPGHEGAPGGHMTAVKLPPFWHRSPASWFRTVEALFALKGMTDNVERYYQVVAALTEELADMVGSVGDKEPTQESYARIKAALVATNTLTPYQIKLMAMEPLGGAKPRSCSHLCRSSGRPQTTSSLRGPSCNAYRVRCGSCWPKMTTPT